ncbi:MAG: hypothetical protein HJJLKODD_01715 [Phycisphaerae bacterium]|nr:hypothetical protein [Phycisphaerae bacterium]
MNLYLGLLMTGLQVGALSGLVGIGGGVFLIPVLVMIFGFSQHQAVGTTLAVMVPPVTLAAALEYYRRNQVEGRSVLCLVVAIFIDSWITARWSHQISDLGLKRLFGVALLVAAVRFIFSK